MHPIRLISRAALLHQDPHFPVTRVVAQCNRPPVRSTHPAQGAEDEILIAPQLFRAPSHTGVLAVGEDVPAGRFQHLLLGERQAPLGTWSRGANLVYPGVVRVEDVREGDRSGIIGVHRLAIQSKGAVSNEAGCRDYRVTTGRRG